MPVVPARAATAWAQTGVPAPYARAPVDTGDRRAARSPAGVSGVVPVVKAMRACAAAGHTAAAGRYRAAAALRVRIFLACSTPTPVAGATFGSRGAGRCTAPAPSAAWAGTATVAASRPPAAKPAPSRRTKRWRIRNHPAMNTSQGSAPGPVTPRGTAAAGDQAGRRHAGMLPAAAAELAERTGRRVGVSALTTPNSATTVSPGGTFKVTESLAPVRAWRGDRWRSLDATLHPGPG